MCHKSSGNFMLQALLAVALAMAFMPMLAGRLALRQSELEFSGIATQAGNATKAAREFIRYNKENIQYGVVNYGGTKFVDLLEPFGLNLGFTPQTRIGQKIYLVVARNENDTFAAVILSGGKLSASNKNELMARLGPNAASSDAKGNLSGIGGWTKNLKDFGIKPDTSAIYILASDGDEFSELLRRKSADIQANRFHTDLSMDSFNVKDINSLSAKNGNFDKTEIGALSISGANTDRKSGNKIDLLTAQKATFQTSDGGANALNISRGDLTVKSFSAQSLFRYGASGSLEAGTVNVNSFSMAAGRTGFTGPYDWSVSGDAILNNVSLNTERLEINGFINAARGQDVFIDQDNMTAVTQSGIQTRELSAAYITLRDQISSSLLAGGTGAVIVDIRPAGVSALPDVSVETINNDEIKIIKDPSSDNGDMTDCRSIIASLSSAPKYDSKSLAQNLVCQYVFWQRLERRVNIKQCLIDGKGNCG